MKIQISKIKINPGRRETSPRYVEELVRSITAVGLLNPITIDQDNTLIAGLHRLEAAKALGWSEIECTVRSVDSLQAELAEIDENFVRSGFSHSQLCELVFRRKEIYESLHPETRRGMRNGQTVKSANPSLLSVKPFTQDTAEKLGISRRTVEQMVQAARDLTPKTKEIIQKADKKIKKTDALKLSRLPPDQQQEAAARLAFGATKATEKTCAAMPPSQLPSAPSEDIQNDEALNSLTKEFVDNAQRFISSMETYKNLAETFQEMSSLQITLIWDSISDVNKTLKEFSEKVNEIKVENKHGGNENGN